MQGDRLAYPGQAVGYGVQLGAKTRLQRFDLLPQCLRLLCRVHDASLRDDQLEVYAAEPRHKLADRSPRIRNHLLAVGADSEGPSQGDTAVQLRQFALRFVSEVVGRMNQDMVAVLDGKQHVEGPPKSRAVVEAASVDARRDAACPAHIVQPRQLARATGPAVLHDEYPRRPVVVGVLTM